MRITQNSLTRNYLSNLTKNLGYLNSSQQKVTTGRAFTRMSENVSDGSKALKLRARLYKNEQMLRNSKSANESLEITETNLKSIKEVLDTVTEQSLKAQNGTNTGELEIYANSFDKMKDQITQFANCTYNDQYLLGGFNIKTPPFSSSEDGRLLYNGSEVNEISKDENGVFSTFEGTVPLSSDVYFDIGLKLNMSGSELDKKSAFKVSASGLDCLGYGMTPLTYVNGNEETVNYVAPNNIIEILGEMSKSMREGDINKLSALDEHLKTSTENLLLQVADIGTRTNFLETNISKQEDSEDQLSMMQSALEGVEDTDELINLSTYKYTWMLTLQYGGSVIPQSLMDYVK